MHSRWEHRAPRRSRSAATRPPLPPSGATVPDAGGGVCLSVQGDLVPFRTFHLFCLQRKNKELPIL